jgi:hypothetical protein
MIVAERILRILMRFERAMPLSLNQHHHPGKERVPWFVGDLELIHFGLSWIVCRKEWMAC